MRSVAEKGKSKRWHVLRRVCAVLVIFLFMTTGISPQAAAQEVVEYPTWTDTEGGISQQDFYSSNFNPDYSGDFEWTGSNVANNWDQITVTEDGIAQLNNNIGGMSEGELASLSSRFNDLNQGQLQDIDFSELQGDKLGSAISGMDGKTMGRLSSEQVGYILGSETDAGTAMSQQLTDEQWQGLTGDQVAANLDNIPDLSRLSPTALNDGLKGWMDTQKPKVSYNQGLTITAAPGVSLDTNTGELTNPEGGSLSLKGEGVEDIIFIGAVGPSEEFPDAENGFVVLREEDLENLIINGEIETITIELVGDQANFNINGPGGESLQLAQGQIEFARDEQGNIIALTSSGAVFFNNGIEVTAHDDTTTVSFVRDEQGNQVGFKVENYASIRSRPGWENTLGIKITGGQAQGSIQFEFDDDGSISRILGDQAHLEYTEMGTGNSIKADSFKGITFERSPITGDVQTDMIWLSEEGNAEITRYQPDGTVLSTEKFLGTEGSGGMVLFVQETLKAEAHDLNAYLTQLKGLQQKLIDAEGDKNARVGETITIQLLEDEEVIEKDISIQKAMEFLDQSVDDLIGDAQARVTDAFGDTDDLSLDDASENLAWSSISERKFEDQEFDIGYMIGKGQFTYSNEEAVIKGRHAEGIYDYINYIQDTTGTAMATDEFIVYSTAEGPGPDEAQRELALLSMKTEDGLDVNFRFTQQEDIIFLSAEGSTLRKGVGLAAGEIRLTPVSRDNKLNYFQLNEGSLGYMAAVFAKEGTFGNVKEGWLGGEKMLDIAQDAAVFAKVSERLEGFEEVLEKMTGKELELGEIRTLEDYRNYLSDAGVKQQLIESMFKAAELELQGNYEGAREQYEALKEEMPAFSIYLDFQIANSYASEGEYDQAIQKLDQMEQEYGDQLEKGQIAGAKAQFYAAQGDYDQAVQQIKDMGVSKDNIDLLGNLLIQAAEGQRLDEDLLDILLSQYRYGLAGQVSSGLKEQLVEIFENAQLLKDAEELRSQGDILEALEKYQSYLDIDTTNPDVYAAVSSIYSQLGNAELATVYSEAAERALAEKVRGAGYDLEQAGFDSLNDYFEKTTQLSLQKASARLQMEDAAGAERAAEYVLGLDAKREDAWKILTSAHMQQGAETEALQTAKDYVDAVGSADSKVNLARILQAQDSLDDEQKQEMFDAYQAAIDQLNEEGRSEEADRINLEFYSAKLSAIKQEEDVESRKEQLAALADEEAAPGDIRAQANSELANIQQQAEDYEEASRILSSTLEAARQGVYGEVSEEMVGFLDAQQNIMVGLAELSREDTDYEKAEGFFSKAKELATTVQQRDYAQALIANVETEADFQQARGEGTYSEMIERFETELREADSSSEEYEKLATNLARAYLEAEDYGKLEQLAKDEDSSDIDGVQSYYANLLLRTGNTESLEEYAQGKEDNFAVQNALTTAYTNLGRLEDAINVLDRVKTEDESIKTLVDKEKSELEDQIEQVPQTLQRISQLARKEEDLTHEEMEQLEESIRQLPLEAQQRAKTMLEFKIRAYSDKLEENEYFETVEYVSYVGDKASLEVRDNAARQAARQDISTLTNLMAGIDARAAALGEADREQVMSDLEIQIRQAREEGLDVAYIQSLKNTLQGFEDQVKEEKYIQTFSSIDDQELLARGKRVMGLLEDAAEVVEISGRANEALKEQVNDLKIMADAYSKELASREIIDAQQGDLSTQTIQGISGLAADLKARIGDVQAQNYLDRKIQARDPSAPWYAFSSYVDAWSGAATGFGENVQDAVTGAWNAARSTITGDPIVEEEYDLAAVEKDMIDLKVDMNGHLKTISALTEKFGIQRSDTELWGDTYDNYLEDSGRVEAMIDETLAIKDERNAFQLKADKTSSEKNRMLLDYFLKGGYWTSEGRQIAQEWMNKDVEHQETEYEAQDTDQEFSEQARETLRVYSTPSTVEGSQAYVNYVQSKKIVMGAVLKEIFHDEGLDKIKSFVDYGWEDVTSLGVTKAIPAWEVWDEWGDILGINLGTGNHIEDSLAEYDDALQGAEGIRQAAELSIATYNGDMENIVTTEEILKGRTTDGENAIEKALNIAYGGTDAEGVYHENGLERLGLGAESTIKLYENAVQNTRTHARDIAEYSGIDLDSDEIELETSYTFQTEDGAVPIKLEMEDLDRYEDGFGDKMTTGQSFAMMKLQSKAISHLSGAVMGKIKTAYSAAAKATSYADDAGRAYKALGTVVRGVGKVGSGIQKTAKGMYSVSNKVGNYASSFTKSLLGGTRPSGKVMNSVVKFVGNNVEHWVGEIALEEYFYADKLGSALGKFGEKLGGEALARQFSALPDTFEQIAGHGEMYNSYLNSLGRSNVRTFVTASGVTTTGQLSQNQFEAARQDPSNLENIERALELTNRQEIRDAAGEIAAFSYQSSLGDTVLLTPDISEAGLSNIGLNVDAKFDVGEIAVETIAHTAILEGGQKIMELEVADGVMQDAEAMQTLQTGLSQTAGFNARTLNTDTDGIITFQSEIGDNTGAVVLHEKGVDVSQQDVTIRKTGAQIAAGLARGDTSASSVSRISTRVDASDVTKAKMDTTVTQAAENAIRTANPAAEVSRGGVITFDSADNVISQEIMVKGIRTDDIQASLQSRGYRTSVSSDNSIVRAETVNTGGPSNIVFINTNQRSISEGQSMEIDGQVLTAAGVDAPNFQREQTLVDEAGNTNYKRLTLHNRRDVQDFASFISEIAGVEMVEATAQKVVYRQEGNTVVAAAEGVAVETMVDSEGNMQQVKTIEDAVRESIDARQADIDEKVSAGEELTAEDQALADELSFRSSEQIATDIAQTAEEGNTVAAQQIEAVEALHNLGLTDAEGSYMEQAEERYKQRVEQTLYDKVEQIRQAAQANGYDQAETARIVDERVRQDMFEEKVKTSVSEQIRLESIAQTVRTEVEATARHLAAREGVTDFEAIEQRHQENYAKDAKAQLYGQQMKQKTEEQIASERLQAMNIDKVVYTAGQEYGVDPDVTAAAYAEAISSGEIRAEFMRLMEIEQQGRTDETIAMESIYLQAVQNLMDQQLLQAARDTATPEQMVRSLQSRNDDVSRASAAQLLETASQSSQDAYDAAAALAAGYEAYGGDINALRNIESTALELARSNPNEVIGAFVSAIESEQYGEAAKFLMARQIAAVPSVNRVMAYSDRLKNIYYSQGGPTADMLATPLSNLAEMGLIDFEITAPASPLEIQTPTGTYILAGLSTESDIFVDPSPQTVDAVRDAFPELQGQPDIMVRSFIFMHERHEQLLLRTQDLTDMAVDAAQMTADETMEDAREELANEFAMAALGLRGPSARMRALETNIENRLSEAGDEIGMLDKQEAAEGLTVEEEAYREELLSEQESLESLFAGYSNVNTGEVRYLEQDQEGVWTVTDAWIINAEALFESAGMGVFQVNLAADQQMQEIRALAQESRPLQVQIIGEVEIPIERLEREAFGAPSTVDGITYDEEYESQRIAWGVQLTGELRDMLPEDSLTQNQIAALEALATHNPSPTMVHTLMSMRNLEAAAAVAGQLGLSDDDMDLLRRAMAVHDLGKLEWPAQNLETIFSSDAKAAAVDELRARGLTEEQIEQSGITGVGMTENFFQDYMTVHPTNTERALLYLMARDNPDMPADLIAEIDALYVDEQGNTVQMYDAQGRLDTGVHEDVQARIDAIYAQIASRTDISAEVRDQATVAALAASHHVHMGVEPGQEYRGYPRTPGELPALLEGKEDLIQVMSAVDTITAISGGERYYYTDESSVENAILRLAQNRNNERSEEFLKRLLGEQYYDDVRRASEVNDEAARAYISAHESGFGQALDAQREIIELQYGPVITNNLVQRKRLTDQQPDSALKELSLERIDIILEERFSTLLDTIMDPGMDRDMKTAAARQYLQLLRADSDVADQFAALLYRQENIGIDVRELLGEGIIVEELALEKQVRGEIGLRFQDMPGIRDALTVDMVRENTAEEIYLAVQEQVPEGMEQQVRTDIIGLKASAVQAVESPFGEIIALSTEAEVIAGMSAQEAESYFNSLVGLGKNHRAALLYERLQGIPEAADLVDNAEIMGMVGLNPAQRFVERGLTHEKNRIIDEALPQYAATTRSALEETRFAGREFQDTFNEIYLLMQQDVENGVAAEIQRLAEQQAQQRGITRPTMPQEGSIAYERRLAAYEQALQEYESAIQDLAEEIRQEQGEQLAVETELSLGSSAAKAAMDIMQNIQSRSQQLESISSPSVTVLNAPGIEADAAAAIAGRAAEITGVADLQVFVQGDDVYIINSYQSDVRQDSFVRAVKNGLQDMVDVPVTAVTDIDSRLAPPADGAETVRQAQRAAYALEIQAETERGLIAQLSEVEEMVEAEEPAVEEEPAAEPVVPEVSMETRIRENLNNILDAQALDEQQRERIMEQSEISKRDIYNKRNPGLAAVTRFRQAEAGRLTEDQFRVHLWKIAGTEERYDAAMAIVEDMRQGNIPGQTEAERNDEFREQMAEALPISRVARADHQYKEFAVVAGLYTASEKLGSREKLEQVRSLVRQRQQGQITEEEYQDGIAEIKSEGEDRNPDEVGMPVPIAGDVWDRNFNDLSKDEIEVLFGLEYTGNDIPVFAQGGREFHVKQPTTIVVNKQTGEVDEIFFEHLTESAIEYDPSTHKVQYGYRIGLKGIGTPNFQGYYYDGQTRVSAPEYTFKTGIGFEHEYQEISTTSIGMTDYRYDIEAQQNEEDLVAKGHPALARSFAFTRLDQAGNGVTFRIFLVDSSERSDVVDYAASLEDISSIREQFGPAYQTITAFSNAGALIGSHIQAGLAYRPEYRIGKDVDPLMRETDPGEPYRVQSQGAERDREMTQNVVARLYNHMNKVYMAYNNNQHLLTEKGLESPEFQSMLLALFDGNQEYVDKVIQELRASERMVRIPGVQPAMMDISQTRAYYDSFEEVDFVHASFVLRDFASQIIYNNYKLFEQQQQVIPEYEALMPESTGRVEACT
ncbi:hypothetical protein GF351_02710 [Candidatus Woesearchaeota archaeon]|nr:hypothetical protein [Candidatus Woesearchaeota archaeon]